MPLSHHDKIYFWICSFYLYSSGMYFLFWYVPGQYFIEKKKKNKWYICNILYTGYSQNNPKQCVKYRPNEKSLSEKNGPKNKIAEKVKKKKEWEITNL